MTAAVHKQLLNMYWHCQVKCLIILSRYINTTNDAEQEEHGE